MRKAWLDYLRVIAIMVVVTGHVAADFYRMFGEISNAAWWLTNILAASLRFAVPVFVMTSGAVLLGKPYTLDEFYKKRAVRLIPPTIFWNLDIWVCMLWMGWILAPCFGPSKRLLL